MRYQDESSVRLELRLLHYPLGTLLGIADSMIYAARVARCEEEGLLQHEEPQLGVHGNGLNRDQDRLQPEKPHLDLRVLCPATPIQEKPLQPPDLPSPWVTNPVTRALIWRLEPFDGPRASRRRSSCCLRHRSLLLLGTRARA